MADRNITDDDVQAIIAALVAAKMGRTPLVSYQSVLSATVIAINDMLFRDDDGTVKPAAVHNFEGTVTATQQKFSESFAGIALEASAAGQTADILTQTGGEYTLFCKTDTYVVGGLLNADGNQTGQGLVNNTLANVTDPIRAIGMVASIPNANQIRMSFQALTPMSSPLTDVQAAQLTDIQDKVTQTTGPGSKTVILSAVVDGEAGDGVCMWVTSDVDGLTMVAGKQYSDGTGKTTFLLDPGTYYVWQQLAGVDFSNPTTLVVTA